MDRHLKEVGSLSYISTDVFNANFYTYTVSKGPAPRFITSGALSAVSGATTVNCPAGHVLRESGKKLYPDVHSGVSTYMVGVYDTSSGLKGFINPNDPMFAPYNTDRPNYQEDSLYTTDNTTKNLGPSVLSLGHITSAGDVTSPGEVVASGQLRSSTITPLITTSNATTLDVSLGQVFTMTTSANVTISLTNPSVGAQVFLIVTGGGSHIITFGTNIKGMGTLSVTNTNIYTIHYICNGTSLFELSRTAAFTDTA
uniref:Uncharacterized protein n=1 Tax=viral metagenome TaxID=1070528 RepID=A0A6C0AMW2_9ZZZZ